MYLAQVSHAVLLPSKCTLLNHALYLQETAEAAFLQQKVCRWPNIWMNYRVYQNITVLIVQFKTVASLLVLKTAALRKEKKGFFVSRILSIGFYSLTPCLR